MCDLLPLAPDHYEHFSIGTRFFSKPHVYKVALRYKHVNISTCISSCHPVKNTWHTHKQKLLSLTQMMLLPMTLFFAPGVCASQLLETTTQTSPQFRKRMLKTELITAPQSFSPLLDFSSMCACWETQAQCQSTTLTPLSLHIQFSSQAD